MKAFLVTLAAILGMTFASERAGAQSYPSRAITMVVPYAAGGSTDAIGRIMAERMSAVLGQTIVPENVGGANGSIGVGRAARAAPDGYTISLGAWPTHVVNGAIMSLSYDVLTDFEPVALLPTQPLLIVARKSMEAQSLKGLVAWLKANPDKASQGHAGIGSTAHIGGVMFQKETGTRFTFVPYRGGGPAMQDLIAGQIDLMFDPAGSGLPHVRAGSIKGYAVTAKTRLAAAPDLPTVDEAGLPGMYVSLWHALWVPKGTPKEVITKLNAAALEAMADPVVQKRLVAIGQELPPPDMRTPDALAAYHKAEIARWWPVIKDAGIKVQ
jgi:tripartite-type tricarboxylate transporter receptor subunit TctC